MAKDIKIIEFTVPEIADIARVTYAPQRHFGHAVEGTEILVVVDLYKQGGKTTRIANSGGTWYKGLSAPSQPKLTAEEARQKLMDLKIRYGTCFGGPQETTLTPGLVSQRADLVVIRIGPNGGGFVPERGKRPAAFALAWKFDLAITRYEGIHVDSQDGRVIK